MRPTRFSQVVARSIARRSACRQDGAPIRPRKVRPEARISALCWATIKFSSAVMPGEAKGARGRLVEAGDAVEHGGLAGAVRADQRGDLAALGHERQLVDG